jgi:general secretion pathway protein M
MKPIGLHKRNNQSLTDFWAIRSTRERVMIASAGFIVLAALVYGLAIAPAIGGRQRLTRDLPALRQQAAEMQELSKDAAELANKSVTPEVAVTRENVEAALSRNGLKAQAVTISDGLVRVQFPTTSFAATMIWVDEMQKSMLLSVMDAHITALSQRDMVAATFTLKPPSHD